MFKNEPKITVSVKSSLIKQLISDNFYWILLKKPIMIKYQTFACFFPVFDLVIDDIVYTLCDNLHAG